MTSDLCYINTMTHDKYRLYMCDNACIVYPPSYNFVTTCNIIGMGNKYIFSIEIIGFSGHKMCIRLRVWPSVPHVITRSQWVIFPLANDLTHLAQVSWMHAITDVIVPCRNQISCTEYFMKQHAYKYILTTQSHQYMSMAWCKTAVSSVYWHHKAVINRLCKVSKLLEHRRKGYWQTSFHEIWV